MHTAHAFFDLETMTRLRKMRRMSPRRLSLKAGLEQHYVRYLERGIRHLEDMKLDSAMQIARVLEVPLSTLLKETSPGWEQATWRHTDKIQRILDWMRVARSCVSLSQGVDSYLLPPEMIQWNQSIRLHNQNWQIPEQGDRIREFTEYAKNAVETRAKSDFQHWIVAREELFTTAAAHEPNWVRQVAENLAAQQNRTFLKIAAATIWGDIELYLRKNLGYSVWHKILILDGRRAVFWPDQDLFFLTESRPMVQLIQSHVQAAMQLAQHGHNQTVCAFTTVFTLQLLISMMQHYEQACTEVVSAVPAVATASRGPVCRDQVPAG